MLSLDNARDEAVELLTSTNIAGLKDNQDNYLTDSCIRAYARYIKRNIWKSAGHTDTQIHNRPPGGSGYVRYGKIHGQKEMNFHPGMQKIRSNATSTTRSSTSRGRWRGNWLVHHGGSRYHCGECASRGLA